MIILRIGKPGIMLLAVSVILLSMIWLARLPLSQVLFSVKRRCHFSWFYFCYICFYAGQTFAFISSWAVLISYEGLTIGIVQIWKFSC
jgi:biotin transport system permease protein/energy-coupling factor transport system permease protein